MARGGRREGAGRKPGSRSKQKVEAETLAREIVEQGDYQRRVRVRALDGTLPPAVETMLWHYAFGKPVERIEHSGAIGVRPEEMDQMSDAQLLALLADKQAGTNGHQEQRG